jgi:hypothetical protein
MNLTPVRISGTLVAGAALLLAPFGCGPNDGVGKRYPISGKVTLNGQPLVKGKINFMADDPEGKPAFGDIKDGSYDSVTTLTPGDGILPGKYSITVDGADDVDQASVAPPRGGMPDQAAVGKAAAKVKRLVPSKYANTKTSGLTYEAKAGSNTYDVPLTE